MDYEFSETPAQKHLQHVFKFTFEDLIYNLRSTLSPKQEETIAKSFQRSDFLLCISGIVFTVCLGAPLIWFGTNIYAFAFIIMEIILLLSNAKRTAEFLTDYFDCHKNWRSGKVIFTKDVTSTSFSIKATRNHTSYLFLIDGAEVELTSKQFEVFQADRLYQVFAWSYGNNFRKFLSVREISQ